MLRFVGLFAVALLALSGCDKGEEEKEGEGDKKSSATTAAEVCSGEPEGDDRETCTKMVETIAETCPDKAAFYSCAGEAASKEDDSDKGKAMMKCMEPCKM